MDIERSAAAEREQRLQVQLEALAAKKEVRIDEGHVREMAQLSTDPLEMPLRRLWTQEEVTFDMGLGEYGITLDMDTTGMVVQMLRRGRKNLQSTSSACFKSTQA